MTLEETSEGELSPSISRAELLGHGLCASYLRSAPDLLKIDQNEDTGHSVRRGSHSVSPGRNFVMSRASSLQPRSPTQSRAKRNNTVGRSQSMKTTRRLRCLEPSNHFRQRVASIPVDMTPQLHSNLNTRSSSDHSLLLPTEVGDFQRLRNFCVTSKGVINRGDSFRSKSRTTRNIFPTGPQPSQNNTTKSNSITDMLPVPDAQDVPPVIVTESVLHRVLIIGSSDVGKSSLTSQFSTSEYISAYDTSLAEQNENSVSIVLNGQETELIFVEHSFSDNMPQVFSATCNIDAFAVVYSVTNKHSFQQAKFLLHQILKHPSNDYKAVVLVGNKTDLVRLREVTRNEGRAAATSYNCKFIETSAGINHHVDELLVGLLTQIRLKRQQEKESIGVEKAKSRSSESSCGKVKRIIKHILHKSSAKSKSCHNLHDL
ncbi:GTP-binding protein GEM-like [Tachypleus tridentatus]|uniref:GTP-binding protein GEM-like n=1 Tax=Tachypleus tridentatus TaxID=6853 RepID=UPI003FD13477